MAKNKKRKIALVTGSRAEYGYLKPLLEEIEKNKDLILKLYVSGLHLAKSYGHTIKEIIADGFKVAKKIDMKVKTKNTPYDLANSIALGIKGFARALKNDKPDLLVVFGDRIEPFAAAIAATALNIPLAHISGGETAFADIDNNLRHAITKLSHLHFTSTKESRDRVLKLGEEAWRVFRAGALSLDAILNKKFLSRDELNKKYNLPDQPFILVAYHPVTTEWRAAGRQMREVLEAVIKIAKKEKMAAVIIYPNHYPGGWQIIKVIKEFFSNNKDIYIFKNFPHLEFMLLMSVSSVFVGNSSSGIIEAPSLGVPYVCVGARQKGRERGNNVIDVDCDRKEIERGINKALFNNSFLDLVKKRKNIYGEGGAAQKIIKVLREVKLDKNLMQKAITY